MDTSQVTLNKVKSLEAVPLSETDMNKLCPGVPVTIFYDLQTKTLDEVLGTNDCGIILFVESKEGANISGHWLAMIRRPSEGTVLLFDPYGGGRSPWNLDRTFVSNGTLNALHESAPYMDEIVQGAGLKPVYNKFRFQRMREGVNTCGRHCAVRVMNWDKSDDEYKSFIEHFSAMHMDPDEAVTFITQQKLA